MREDILNKRYEPWSASRLPNRESMTKHLREFVFGRDDRLEGLYGQVGKVPKVTVITPSYNQGHLLERTILSVLNQGYPNLEYIVIDGGSTDHSLEVIKKYERYLTYWSSKPDNGQSDAINKGLAMATGEWVGFQNSDDLFLPGALSALMEAAMRNPNADVTTGHLLHINENDSVIDVQLVVPTRMRLQLGLGPQFHNQATLWKRCWLNQVGLPREDMQFCFDYEYFTRLIRHGARVCYVDRYIGAFRIHRNAKSSTMLDVATREDAMVREMYGWPRASKLVRLLLRTYKAAWYVVHGKSWYLVRNV